MSDTLSIFGSFDYENTNRLYIDGTNDLPYIWQFHNNDFALGAYGQLQVYYDNWTTAECSTPTAVVALNADSVTDTYNLVLTGHSGISEIDIVQSDSSAVDGDGCFTGNTLSAYINTANNVIPPPDGGDFIIIGLPAGSSGSQDSSSTTTLTVIDNPTLDFFMGMLLFWIAVFFFVWVWKGKK